MIKSYIVTESSEFLSSDEEEDDEDVLSRGTVRILWHPNGSETVEEEKKVNLYFVLKILLNFFNIFYQICVSGHFVWCLTFPTVLYRICVLQKPITYLVNLSISSGVVPEDMKVARARVCPIFKKNSRSDVGNYRPVSILIIISKILGKKLFIYILRNNY